MFPLAPVWLIFLGRSSAGFYGEKINEKQARAFRFLKDVEAGLVKTIAQHLRKLSKRINKPIEVKRKNTRYNISGQCAAIALKNAGG